MFPVAISARYFPKKTPFANNKYTMEDDTPVKVAVPWFWYVSKPDPLTPLRPNLTDDMQRRRRALYAPLLKIPPAHTDNGYARMSQVYYAVRLMDSWLLSGPPSPAIQPSPRLDNTWMRVALRVARKFGDYNSDDRRVREHTTPSRECKLLADHGRVLLGYNPFWVDHQLRPHVEPQFGALPVDDVRQVLLHLCTHRLTIGVDPVLLVLLAHAVCYTRATNAAMSRKLDGDHLRAKDTPLTVAAMYTKLLRAATGQDETHCAAEARLATLVLETVRGESGIAHFDMGAAERNPPSCAVDMAGPPTSPDGGETGDKTPGDKTPGDKPRGDGSPLIHIVSTGDKGNYITRKNDIAKGAYGEVFHAEYSPDGTCCTTDAHVETKVCKRLTGNLYERNTSSEGLYSCILRELVFLLQLEEDQKHNTNHLVPIDRVLISGNAAWNTVANIYILMPPYRTNLFRKVQQDRKHGVCMGMGNIKYVMWQILHALHTVHARGFVHGDVKPENVLLEKVGKEKKHVDTPSPWDVVLTDFSLTMPISMYADSPILASTIWYRAPELILGQAGATPAMDIWAAGTMLVWMVNHGRHPWPATDCELDQLYRIFQVLKTPTIDTGPSLLRQWQRRFAAFGLDSLPAWDSGIPFRTECAPLDDHGVNLVRRMLHYEQSHRISAWEALHHPWFTADTEFMARHDVVEAPPAIQYTTTHLWADVVTCRPIPIPRLPSGSDTTTPPDPTPSGDIMATSTQCKAILASRQKRCSKRTKAGHGYCYMHAKKYMA